MHQITLIRCQGDITGIIEARKLGPDYGSISQVEVDGDFLGSMNAEKEIDQLIVDGDIGTSTTNATITADKQIAFIQASRMWATINVTNSAGDEGWLGHVETTGGATGDFNGSISARLVSPTTVSTPFSDIVIDGDFNGTLDLTDGGELFGGVTSPIEIAGDMTGNMKLGNINGASPYNGYLSVAGDVSGDIEIKALLTSPTTVEILGELTSTGSIIFGDAASIDGQVIINSANGGDEWDGTVKVNGASGTTLSPAPYYTNTAGTVGSGSVGEVPYSCHFGQCDPAGTHFGTAGVASASASITQVKLWHYGPVTWTSGFPFVVSRCASGLDCEPGANVVSGCTILAGSGTREVTVGQGSHDFQAGYHYHFQPVIGAGSNQLRCFGINASNVPVKNYLYTVIMN